MRVVGIIAGLTELVVGIPSYQEADFIRYPTLQADEGLLRYFPEKRSVIVNCDNHSPDNTRDAFLGIVR